MTSRHNRSSPDGSSRGSSTAGSAAPSAAKHGPSVRKAVPLTSVRADPGRILAPAAQPAAGAARGEGEETARSRPDTASVAATDALVPASSGTTSGTSGTSGTTEEGAATGAAASRQQAESTEQAEPKATGRTREQAARTAQSASAGAPEDEVVTLAVAGGASGDGTARGDDEPPSGNQKKPLLAAAGIAGTVLLAVPLLIWATDDSERKSDKSSVAADANTVLGDKSPDARQGNYAPAEPTTKPTTTKPTTAGKDTKAPSPSTTPRTNAPRSDRTTPPKATKETSGGGAGKPTAGAVAHNTVNLARGRSVSADSHVEDFVGSHVTDGDAATYWESTKGTDTFPHSIRVDLGAEKSVSKIVLKLPQVADWNSRTQTLSVWGAHNTSNAFTLASSAGYTFDAATGNSVTIRFSNTATRYIELRFTANSGWPAAQLSELAAY